MNLVRWQRRVIVLLALVLGIADLASAASVRDPDRLPPLASVLGTAVGVRYAVLLAGMGLVLLTRGLLHGKRNAARLAIGAALLSIPGNADREVEVFAVAAAGALLGSLALGRRAFRARNDPRLARQGLAVIATGLGATFAYGTIGLYFLDDQFRERTGIGTSAATAARLTFLLPAGVEPLGRHGRWFTESVRVIALTVVVVGLARLVATVVARPGRQATERATVSDILERYGTTALAHFHLLDDKLWFIHDDAFIGYKVVGTVAVALGEPVGSETGVDAVTADYLEFCDDNGWTPAFHQVTEPGADGLRRAGLRVLKIGEDAVVDVQHFDLGAKTYKSMRSSLRRVERAGCRSVVHAPPLSDELLDRLEVVSDEWLAAGGHRERTFTLGRFDRDYLRETTIVAVERGDEVVAFANVLPTYRSTDGNFDLMRRRPDAPNGVMEYLFVALIELFRAEGLSGMDLGLAPLAGSTGTSVPARALSFLYEHGEASFHFEGLRAFKEKWHPRWEPRFLCYRRDTDLPRVVAAVVRAGELPDPRAPVQRVAGIVRRFPFTIALSSVVLWLTVVTASDHDIHVELMRRFGLRWQDIVDGGLWRYPTSQLLQPSPGFVVGNLVLLVLVLPLAERRLRSSFTIAVFFLADWISTTLALMGAQIATMLGSEQARLALRSREAGVSSGLWGLAAALVWTARPKTLRGRGLGVLGAVLIGSLAVEHRLVDVEHLSAALVGIVIAELWQRRGRQRPRPESTAQPIGVDRTTDRGALVS